MAGRVPTIHDQGEFHGAVCRAANLRSRAKAREFPLGVHGSPARPAMTFWFVGLETASRRAARATSLNSNLIQL
jgi:hypothetical protein